jgi:hypothetical protein
MGTAVPSAGADRVSAAVTGALAPVAGLLAPVVGSLAGSLAKSAMGDPSSQEAQPAAKAPEQRLDLHPLSSADLQRFTSELAAKLRDTDVLKPRNIRVRSYQIPVKRADEEAEQPFLNSFYSADLDSAATAAASGDVGHALAEYLTSSQRLDTSRRVDVRTRPERSGPATRRTGFRRAGG